jgi:hypothetical protein
VGGHRRSLFVPYIDAPQAERQGCGLARGTPRLVQGPHRRIPAAAIAFDHPRGGDAPDHHGQDPAPRTESQARGLGLLNPAGNADPILGSSVNGPDTFPGTGLPLIRVGPINRMTPVRRRP